MALAPFGDQFPLGDDSGTYNSRISEFLSRPVNYIFTIILTERWPLMSTLILGTSSWMFQ